MTDLAVLAIGLGVIPLAAILLYSFRGFVLTRREAVWGFLAGVLAFLALGHAMAGVLVNKSLFGDTAIAIAVAFVGLAVGAGIAWLVLEGPFIQKEPNRILWVAVAFLGLHSLGDGLVLGRDFVRSGPIGPSGRAHRRCDRCPSVRRRVFGRRSCDLGSLEGKAGLCAPARLVRIRSSGVYSGRRLQGLRQLASFPRPGCRSDVRRRDRGEPWLASTRPRVPPDCCGGPRQPLALVDGLGVHRDQPRPLLRRVRLTPRGIRARPSRARERPAQR